MTNDKLIDQWRLGLRISHRAHFEAAKYYEQRHLMISVPAVVMSAMLGTTVFAHLQFSENSVVKFLLAVCTVSMIVLSSLQAFLKYAECAERHKTAAVQIGEIRRELEQLLAYKPNPADIAVETATVLRKKWDATDRQAPTIPTRIYSYWQNEITREELANGGITAPPGGAAGKSAEPQKKNPADTAAASGGSSPTAPGGSSSQEPA